MKRLRQFLPTGILVLLAALAVLFMVARYTVYPWTRFGQVRAFVIEVAPRISARVVEVAVTDNQAVKQGDLLFRLYKKPYELDLSLSQRKLQLARQQVAQLEAAIDSAEAVVAEKKAAVTSAEGKVAEVEATIRSARAVVEEAEAGVVSAEAEIAASEAELTLAQQESVRATRLAEQRAGSVEMAEIKVASVNTEKAQLASSMADRTKAQAGVTKAQAGLGESEAQMTIARNGLAEAEGALVSAIAKLAEAKATLGQPGEENVRIQEAQVSVEQARVNLNFTSVYAPSDGYITNLQVNVGTFASEGRPIMAHVNSNTYWVYAFFRETQLRHIHQGDQAIVTLMAHRDQPLKGTVQNINWAIAPPDIATMVDLIPQIQPTFNWVRLAQRVPVRIRLTEVPDGIQLVVGTTASVSIHPAK